MPLPFTARQVLAETLPVAAILAFWTTLDALVRMGTPFGAGLRWAGLVMGLLYVAVEGRRRGRTIDAPQPTALRGHLEENLQVLAGAGGWFLLVVATTVLQTLADLRHLEIAGVATFVFAATGVLTVVYCAVALGTARLSSDGQATAGVGTDD